MSQKPGGVKRVEPKMPPRRGAINIDQLYSRVETIKDRTRNLLIKYPSARDNNLFALLAYMRENLGVKVPTLTEEQLNNDGVIETVLRSIREIQHEEGVLLPNSPQIRHKRGITNEAWRRWRRRGKGKEATE